MNADRSSIGRWVCVGVGRRRGPARSTRVSTSAASDVYKKPTYMST